ncbi:MAG: UDP-glucose 4-epimerase [Edaphobacter sp.]|nr:UDP-glucose 4-epimerase [Edaphobacter sp.]
MLQNIFTWLDQHYDKIAVEEAIRGDPAVSWTVLRLPMVYGPGDPLHRFFPLLKRVTDGRSLLLPRISPGGGVREDMWRMLRMQ